MRKSDAEYSGPLVKGDRRLKLWMGTKYFTSTFEEPNKAVRQLSFMTAHDLSKNEIV